MESSQIVEALDTDERSRPWSAFTLPGIRVHLALERVFTFGWNPCSHCPGIRIPLLSVACVNELEWKR